jgi:hypothetical protein
MKNTTTLATANTFIGEADPIPKVEAEDPEECPRCGSDIRDDGGAWDGFCSSEECSWPMPELDN